MVKFSKFILIQSVIIFFIGLFPVLSWGELYLKEISIAFFLSLANVFLGYFLVINSFTKKTSEFYKMVYGGMMLRMFFMLSFSIFMINKNYFEAIPFMLSLICFYIIHQWTEIFFWIKDLKGKTVEI